MKNLTILLLFLLLGMTANAQQFTEVTSSRSKISLNEYNKTVIIDGQRFIGGQSRTGSIWIRKLSSKSNKYYKQYLGTKTSLIHQGHNVWTTRKKDKYWYFIAKNNTLSKIYLKRTS